MNLPAVVPQWLRMVYPRRTWSLSVEEKILYLSFDDGPHPTITPRVLDILKEYNAKATFFCIGKNVANHPSVFERVIEEGHSIGNHTYHHVNGWRTSNHAYLDEVEKAAACIPSNLFRPPYGRLKFRQASKLVELGYELIMWTILSGDYDRSLSKEACAERIVKNLSPGAIILMHDSEKAANNMLHALEVLLKEATLRGYRFEGIDKKKGSV